MTVNILLNDLQLHRWCVAGNFLLFVRGHEGYCLRVYPRSLPKEGHRLQLLPRGNVTIIIFQTVLHVGLAQVFEDLENVLHFILAGALIGLLKHGRIQVPKLLHLPCQIILEDAALEELVLLLCFQLLQILHQVTPVLY
jgi:hypothetical protein